MNVATTAQLDIALLDGLLRVGVVRQTALEYAVPVVVDLMLRITLSNQGLQGTKGLHSSSSAPGQGEEKQSSGNFGASFEFVGGKNVKDATTTGEGVNFMLIFDSQGLSVVVNEFAHAIFQESNSLALPEKERGNTKNASGDDPVTWDVNGWRAFEIHAGNGCDTAQIVAFLSSQLSEQSISILNYTAFSSDFILVQEKDVKRAVQLLCSVASTFVGVDQLRNHLAKTSEKKAKTRDTDYLKVLSNPLALLRLNPNQIKRCVFGIMNQIHRAILASRRSTATNATNDDQTDLNTTFFAIFSTSEETCLITDWDSLEDDFEPGSVLVSPRSFRAIRFCGHDFDLNETGLVSLLFSPAAGEDCVRELLTCSTFFTSYVLVSPEDVEFSIDRIKKSMTSGQTTKVVGLLSSGHLNGEA